MSNPLYYPNRDMLASGFPTNWTLLKRLMWVRIMRGGSIAPTYETVTGNPVTFQTVRAAPLRKLQIAFSPVQDLNGQDAPWPAGGGKNLLYQMPTTSQTINDVAWSINADGSITANGTATGNSTFIYINDESGIGYSFDGDYKYKNFGYVSASIMNIGVKIGGVWKTVYSNSYSDVSDVHGQIEYMWFQIRNGQTANNITIYPLICKASETEPTAWTPYSNICPISGWDSLGVEMRGKNLLPNDISAYSDNDAYYYIPAIMPLNTLAVMSLADRDTSVDISGCYIGFIGDYNGTGSPTKYKWVINNGTISADKTNVEQTSLRTGKCEGIFIYPGNTETFNKLFSRFNIQVELGSTASEYQPYNGRSISISLGSTVYSGWVDAVTGIGEVTMASVDLGTLDWIYYGNLLLFATKVVDGKPTGSSTPSSNAFCSQYAKFVGGYRQLPDDSVMVGSYFYEASSCAVVVHDETYSDAATFKAAMSGVQLVYELATPIPIQLTPQEINSLAGDNVMWSNANGDLTITYRSN